MDLKFWFQVFSLLGLCCEIMAGWLLFKYAWPPHIVKFSQMTYGGGDRTEEDKVNKKYEKKSKIGFILLLLGFFIQLPNALYSIYNN